MGGAVEGDAFPNALFQNPNPTPEHAWIVRQLEGRTANRSAIGARIRLTVDDPGGAPRTIHATVSTGGSFGASSLQQEIGLGRATGILELRVAWPNGERTVETHADLEVNRAYHVIERTGVHPIAWDPARVTGPRPRTLTTPGRCPRRYFAPAF